jgi:hypothetical protein
MVTRTTFFSDDPASTENSFLTFAEKVHLFDLRQQSFDAAGGLFLAGAQGFDFLLELGRLFANGEEFRFRGLSGGQSGAELVFQLRILFSQTGDNSANAVQTGFQPFKDVFFIFPNRMHCEFSLAH